MLAGILLLLLCQLVGELLAATLAPALPGPVIGLLLLFLLLQTKPRVPAGVGGAARGLLQHLALLFVPAGVGIMAHGSLLREEGPKLLITLVLSTLVAMAVTGLALQALLRRRTTHARRADGQ